MPGKVEVDCPTCDHGNRKVETGGEAWAYMNEHRKATGHYMFWVELPAVSKE